MLSTVRNVTLLDLDEPRLVRGPVDLVIADGRITTVHAAWQSPPEATDLDATDLDATDLDATGLLAMPGLVNAHLHSTGRWLRWTVPNLPLELFLFWELPLGGEAGAVAPEHHRLRTLLQAAELLRSGATAVLDDPILLPPDEAAAEAIFDAYRTVGIRATVGLYRPNSPPSTWLPFLAEQLPAELRRQLDGALPPAAADDAFHRMSERIADRWHGVDGRLRCAVSCAAPTRCTDEYLADLHARAVALDAPFVVHLCESKAQRLAGDLRYGRPALAHLRELGVLDHHLTATHAVWVDESDAAALAGAGATVVHSPAGNLRCGSGIMPWAMLRDAGVPIALCTDEATVEESSSLWSVARLAGMLHTVADPDPARWPTEREILRSLTAQGAKALGQPTATGTLAVGSAADFVLLARPPDVPADGDGLARWLVYGHPDPVVRTVVVAGRVVVAGGTVATIDEAALREEASALLERAGPPAGAGDLAEQVRPYVDAVYRRCAALEVGFTRWVPRGAAPGRTAAT